MRSLAIAGIGITKDVRDSLKGPRDLISGIESDCTTMMFTVTKYDSFSEKVKAAKTLMELDYIYKERDLVNDPELMNEFMKISAAIKTINLFATTRAKKRNEEYFAKKKQK